MKTEQQIRERLAEVEAKSRALIVKPVNIGTVYEDLEAIDECDIAIKVLRWVLKPGLNL